MIQKSFIYQGSIQKIKSILIAKEYSNIFLIRGNQSYEKSGAQDKLSLLLKNYNIIEFKGFSVNPKLEEAIKGYQLFKESNCDIILAVGGGSVIDMSKIIKYLYLNENQLNPSANIPIIAVPTTAGTGSEATHFAVVYVNAIKKSYSHKLLLPDYAVVDADLLQGQSKYQMAVSGIDAFAQGIESFWSIHSTVESMKYAEKAIVLVWENLEKSIGGQKDAIIKLAEGSYYAGKAINITKTTAPHALSYGFTSNFGLAHGHAVALFLPFFINYHKTINNERCNDPRGPLFVRNQLIMIAKLLHTNLDQIETSITTFFKILQIEIDFQKLNIDYKKFQKALLGFSQERINNNPAKLNRCDFKNIFYFTNN